MKGEMYLNKSYDFALVHSQGRWFGARALGIKIRSNGLDTSRWGIVIGRRLGGAVVRNRTKRRLREIMRQVTLRPGSDIVILTRPVVLTLGYTELKEVLVRLLSQAGLMEQV